MLKSVSLSVVRCVGRSLLERVFRLMWRCITLTQTSSVWETPAPGKSLSYLDPCICLSLRWLCPSSLLLLPWVRDVCVHMCYECSPLYWWFLPVCDLALKTGFDHHCTTLSLSLHIIIFCCVFLCVVGQLKGQSPFQIVRSVFCICLGFFSQYYLLRCVSGLSCGSSLAVMLLCRAMFSLPYIHVNIFQVKYKHTWCKVSVNLQYLQ